MEGNGLTSPEVGLPRGLLVIFGEHSGAARMLDLTAGLSLRGPLYLLDCGNRSNMYRVARTLRTLTDDPVAVMRNIRLSRAFTCYQVVTLLQETPARPLPTLVLDILSTFLDENVTLEESQRLLKVSIEQLTRLSLAAPVVVSVKPLLALSADRLPLLDMLSEAASRTIVLEEPRPQPSAALPLWQQSAD